MKRNGQIPSRNYERFLDRKRLEAAPAGFSVSEVALSDRLYDFQRAICRWALAREEKDERHICPLQLQVIERGIELWTNPGDLVLDPFAGIGSTGHVAVKKDRRFLGIELKDSYYRIAVRNLREAESEARQAQIPLFVESGSSKTPSDFATTAANISAES